MELNNFHHNSSFLVGNRRRVKFWKVKWCGDEPLRCTFPSLYTLASLKEAWVIGLWVHEGERGHWNLCFSKSLNDWEVDIVEELFSRLQGEMVVGEEEDKVVWMNLSNNKFSLKLLYDALKLKEMFNFQKSVVWNSLVPSKASFFVWEASLGKVLIVD